MRWQDRKIFEAVAAKDVQALVIALNAGGDPNTVDVNDRPPLWHAVGHLPELTEVLLERGANPGLPDERGYTPFMHAVADKDYAAARRMLKAGADVSAQPLANGLTPLHSAIFADARDNGHARVRFVLEQKPDLSLLLSYDNGLMTPLQLAKHLGHDASAGLIGAAVAAQERERAQLAAAFAERAAQHERQRWVDVAEAQQRLHARAHAQSRKLRL